MGVDIQVHVSADDLRKELRQSKSSPAAIRSAIAEAQQSRFVEPILELLGARQVESLDFSNYEQATIVHDTAINTASSR
jgi:hypothetical protein